MPVITVRIKYHLFFPILLRAARQYWRDDVCSAVYRFYFCTNCTNTQCLLRRRTFASWVILIGCAKTDGPVTGNITGSFCICLLANTAWPSYRRIARSISNNMLLSEAACTDHSASVIYGKQQSSFISNTVLNVKLTNDKFWCTCDVEIMQNVSKISAGSIQVFAVSCCLLNDRHAALWLIVETADG